MKETFSSIVGRYGRTVVCYDKGGAVTGAGRAFVQPITEKEWQKSAGALGAFRTDRFLCLAPVSLPVGEPGDGSWLECGGQTYVPIAVHAIHLGEEQTHWWAVLEPKDEVTV